MFEQNGDEKLFYRILGVTSDKDFVQAVDSYADNKQNLANAAHQIHSLRSWRKFEKEQRDALARLETKLKSREEKQAKLKNLAPTHKKHASLLDKVKRLTRRIREMRAFFYQVYQQECVKRALQREPLPYQVDWWRPSPDIHDALTAQIAEMKQKKADLVSFQKNLERLLEESRKLIQEKIKKQYKRLAFQFHPDRYQGDTQSEGYVHAVKTFQDLSQAFQILSDDAKRERYNTAPSHEVYLTLYPEDLNLEEAVVATKPTRHRQQQRQQQQQLRIEYALPEKCPRPTITPRKRGKGWILNVDWTARSAYTHIVTHFACEVQLEGGPFDLVYGGQKAVFEYIARLPGFYSFRARACNALGEGPPSEEACILIKDGEAFDPYEPNGTARISSKTSVSRLSNLRKRRAKRKKLLRLPQGEEPAAADQKQPKDNPQVRQLHKLIYSPHCTVKQLETFLSKNGLDLLGQFTSASSRGKGGENALIASIRAERADLADFFLRRQNVAHYDPNASDAGFGRSPLIWAIMMHQSEIAFAILQLKNVSIDVNKADNDGCTPLYWAVALRSSYALVNALVKRGADPNQPLVDDSGRPTFLLHEFIVLNDADASRQLITQFNALPDPLETFEELYQLEIAACIDEIEMVGEAVDPVSLTSSANLERSATDETSETPLEGDEAEIDSLSDSDDEHDGEEEEEGELDEEDEDDLPDPPILSALQQRSSCGFEVFTLLADRWLSSVGDSDLALRNRRLSIMAHFAVVLSNLEALRWLVQARNFQVDSLDPDTNRTVLHTALALDADNSTLAFLMQECNCNDQIEDKNGFNPLQLSNLIAEQKDLEADAARMGDETSPSQSTASSDASWGDL
eukprot:TRINITY_DN2468_c0_g1_i1.p1 TRINITY_DN2468_c0_g1~~TRINITY_DN2468_c0_g1_i1.p1  ORF type:complete len:858 (+),score=171.18 TRINITY_DN2468_c0_g1_i1:110-2683(+)